MTPSSRRPRLLPTPIQSAEQLLDEDTRERLVRDLRAHTEGRLFEPPLEWAILAGFEIAVAHELPDVYTASEARTLLYVWHPDRRQRGLRQYCGLSGVLLRSQGVAHTWRDLWCLALDLAVPVEVRCSPAARVARAQHYCPIDVIEQVLSGRW